LIVYYEKDMDFNMKKLVILFFFLMVSSLTMSQKNVVDTSEMCIPYSVAQKILLDLSDYDRIKEIKILNEKEIKELNSKIQYQEKIIIIWEEKDSTNNVIIKKTEEKFEIYKEENKSLSKENKRLKTKNTLFSIISGVIIAPLTYLVLFK
jgi:hypothetical protein